MTALERVPTRDLTTLAAEIRREHEKAEADYQSAFAHAIRAGALLIEAKAQVKHGEWLPWLKANFPGSVRSAQGYMRLAEHAPECATVAHSGIKGALKQLAAPEVTEPEAQPDRCPRCKQIVRNGRPHKCIATSRLLTDAHDALKLALADLRRYPPEVAPGTVSDSEMAATVVHLASEVQRALGGEPERDERQQRLDHVQRVIEGKGHPVCSCGARLTEFKGDLICFACSKDEAVAS